MGGQLGVGAERQAAMSIQRRMYERQIDGRRQREMFENEMGEVSKYHRKMVEVAKSDGRVEQKRREQEIAAANFEMKREQNFIQEEQNDFRQKTLQEQETRIAAELQRRKIEEFRDEKMVQKIRESSEELRELEEKLKAAYMTKERKAQMQEKQIVSHIRNEEEAKLDMMMEEDRRRGVHMDAKEGYMRKAAALEAQDQLEEQILEHEHQKELAYQAYLEEKAKVDALVTKIQEEDRAEMDATCRKKAETQGWIQNYLEDRREWKKQEQQQVRAEEEAIIDYAAKKRAEQGAWEAKKQAEQDFKDRMCAEIAAEIRRKEMEREELEDIRETLALEEEEERLRRKEEGERKKRDDDRAMMMAAAEEAKMVKAARLEKEREEEAAFRDAMLQKFAEEDKLEQMSAQRRRMKQAEHQREVERLMEERRQSYEAQRMQEAAEREIEERAERFRQEIIERERQRLLEEHLPHLGGNIPKGVLQKEEDTVYLQERPH